MIPDFYHSQSLNDSFYHDYPKIIHRRQLYFETFDNIINCIKGRFNQIDYHIYVHIQEIFIKAFLLLPEIPKLYGFDSRMQLSEMIALYFRN